MPAFAVIIYPRLNSLARRLVVCRETVDTEKLPNVARDELLIYRDIVAAERCAAFLAGLSVLHYHILTILARSIMQPCGSRVVTKRSVNVPRFFLFQQSYISSARPEA